MVRRQLLQGSEDAAERGWPGRYKRRAARCRGAGYGRTGGSEPAATVSTRCATWPAIGGTGETAAFCGTRDVTAGYRFYDYRPSVAWTVNHRQGGAVTVPAF